MKLLSKRISEKGLLMDAVEIDVPPFQYSSFIVNRSIMTAMCMVRYFRYNNKIYLIVTVPTERYEYRYKIITSLNTSYKYDICLIIPNYSESSD